MWERPETGGKTFVINRCRCSNANLRTQFNRIVRNADFEPWQKPFQNMRSTGGSELVNEYPIHGVCGWIGNSSKVAKMHGLQTIDEHFGKSLNQSAKVT